MRATTEYRVYVGGKPIDRKLYDMIETVTVEESIDLATEARIELEMCANERGEWNGPGDAYARPWNRVRIEVRNLSSGWVPLIDGPVVAWNAGMSGDPGQSMLTVVVRDDSIYLNHDVQPRVFEGMSDWAVAQDLLTTGPISVFDIDPLPERPSDRLRQHMKLGTQMDMLLEIARAYDRHVYVRPTTVIGMSIGCLKKLDLTRTARLPALTLVGRDRNMQSFNLRAEPTNAAKYLGGQQDTSELMMTRREPKLEVMPWPHEDHQKLGARDAVEDPRKVGIELVDPEHAELFDLAEVVASQQRRSSLIHVATGSVIPGVYPDVLTTYDVVAASGVHAKLATKYVIKEVTHTLTRQEYRQDFTLITNSIANEKTIPPLGIQ